MGKQNTKPKKKQNNSIKSNKYNDLCLLYRNSYEANQERFFIELDKHMADVNEHKALDLLVTLDEAPSPHPDMYLKAFREIVGNALYDAQKRNIMLDFRGIYKVEEFKYRNFGGVSYLTALQILQEPLRTGPAKHKSLTQLAVESDSFNLVLSFLELGFSLEIPLYESPAKDMIDLIVQHHPYFIFIIGLIPEYLPSVKAYLSNKHNLSHVWGLINSKNVSNKIHQDSFENSIGVCLQHDLPIPIELLSLPWLNKFANILMEKIDTCISFGGRSKYVHLAHYLQFFVSLSTPSSEEWSTRKAYFANKLLILKQHLNAIDIGFTLQAVFTSPQAFHLLLPPFLLALIESIKQKDIAVVLKQILQVEDLLQKKIKCNDVTISMVLDIMLSIFNADQNKDKHMELYKQCLAGLIKINSSYEVRKDKSDPEEIIYGNLKTKTYKEAIIPHDNVDIYLALMQLGYIPRKNIQGQDLLESSLYLAIHHNANKILRILSTDKNIHNLCIEESGIFQGYSPVLYAIYNRKYQAIKVLLLSGEKFDIDVSRIKTKKDREYLQKLYIEALHEIANHELEELSERGLSTQALKDSLFLKLYFSEPLVPEWARGVLLKKALGVLCGNTQLLQIVVTKKGSLDAFVATKTILITFFLKPTLDSLNQFDMIAELVEEAVKLVGTFSSLTVKNIKYFVQFGAHGLYVGATSNYIEHLKNKLHANEIEFDISRNAVTILYTEENVAKLIDLLTEFNKAYQAPVEESSTQAILGSLETTKESQSVTTSILQNIPQPLTEVPISAWVKKRPWLDKKYDPQYVKVPSGQPEPMSKEKSKQPSPVDNASVKPKENKPSNKIPEPSKIQSMDDVNEDSYSFSRIANHKALKAVLGLAEIIADSYLKINKLDTPQVDILHFTVLGGAMELFYYLHKVAKSFTGVNDRVIDAKDAAEAKNLLFYSINNINDIKDLLEFTLNSIIPLLRNSFENNGMLPTGNFVAKRFNSIMLTFNEKIIKTPMTEQSFLQSIVIKLKQLKTIYGKGFISDDLNNNALSIDGSARCAINFITASIIEDCFAVPANVISAVKLDTILTLVFGKMDVRSIRNAIRHPDVNTIVKESQVGKSPIKFSEFFQTEEPSRWVKTICADDSGFKHVVDELEKMLPTNQSAAKMNSGIKS